MTQLESLKKEYPDLSYDTGCFFENMKDWIEDAPLTVSKDSAVVLNATLIIEDHFEGHDVIINPQERNPELEETREGTGAQVIQQRFDGDYVKAFKEA